MCKLQIPFAPFPNSKEAKLWAGQHIVKVYNNEETGGKGFISISKEAVGKYVSNSAVCKSFSRDVHFSVLRCLPEVIRSSILGETHPDYIKIDGVRRPENGTNPHVTIQRLYACVGINDQDYRVKITLKVYKDKSKPTKVYTFEITRIG
jgi:hypothetical protein